MTEPFQIHHGDNREILKTLPAGSIDACISDPPYELGFMGRKWDATGIAYDAEMWREVFRVMKPGAHLVAFGGTRTYHRMACAIEDAGFEIRDQLAWTYASGFPKSMDVSKALDRQKGNRDEILRVTKFVREAAKAAGVTNRQIDETFGMNGMAGHWTSSTSQPAVPTAEQWPKLLDLLRVDEVPEELRSLVEKIIREKGQPGPNWFKREVTGVHDQAAPAQVWNKNFGNPADATPKERRDNAASEDAKRWQGWGTALKPAWEPIVLARKPLAGTVAANVTKHGVGALNIDGTRIPYASAADAAAAAAEGLRSSDAKRNVEGWGMKQNRVTAGEYAAGAAGLGRFPSNLMHDGSPEVLEAFGPGEEPPAAGPARSDGSESGWLFDEIPVPENAICREDLTGPARFFFCAKASSDDREAGLDAQELVTLSCDLWEAEGRKVQLQVDTATSPPKVIGVFGAQSSDVKEWSTWLFGKRPTGPSRPAFKFITSTRTNSIIESATLRLFLRSLTSGSTADANSSKDNGGSRAESAESGNPFASITFESTESPPGAKSAASPNRFRISETGRSPATHPTVKPTALMRWLVRLITPRGGKVLDHFTGSGSTGRAAVLEGCQFVGIEQDLAHVEIARARVREAVGPLFV
jgi:DNA modification methylase